MYQQVVRLVIRTLNGTNYLIPIGGDWTKTADLVEIDDVAALIIQRLPATIEQLVDEIVKNYDVSEETAFEDTSSFLEELISFGLIEEVLNYD